MLIFALVDISFMRLCMRGHEEIHEVVRSTSHPGGPDGSANITYYTATSVIRGAAKYEVDSSSNSPLCSRLYESRGGLRYFHAALSA